MSQKQHKYTVTFTDRSRAVLSYLARRHDVSGAEVIRLALNVLYFMTNEIDNGNRPLVEREGKLVEVALINLERVDLTSLPGEVVEAEVGPIQWDEELPEDWLNAASPEEKK